jgi:hypothetical protein
MAARQNVTSIEEIARAELTFSSPEGSRMPVTYTPDINRKRIRVIASDPVTLTEMIASVDRQWTDGMWTLGVIVDLRRSHTPPSIATAQAVAAHIRALTEQLGPRGPVAMVARDPVMLAEARVYKHFSAKPDPHVEVFWSADDAEAWLDDFEKQNPTADS